MKKLQQFSEKKEFSVTLFEQDGQKCADLEKWTNGGVDMIITLMPFTKKSFIEWVENFDVDEEIDTHRQSPEYRSAFPISRSLKDFTDFKNHLIEIKNQLP